MACQDFNIVRVARVVICDKQRKLLLYTRKPGKEYFELGISGKMEVEDLDIEGCAQREVKEELRIEIPSTSFEFLYDYLVQERRLMITAFLAHIDSNTPVIINEELEEICWISASNPLSLPLLREQTLLLGKALDHLDVSYFIVEGKKGYWIKEEARGMYLNRKSLSLEPRNEKHKSKA